jgi:hypothetical protein
MRCHRLILATALVAVVGGAGCGGSSHHPVDPRVMLDAAAAHPITSADTEIDLHLQVEGIPQLSAPLRLRLDGPYVSGGGARIPSFDWRLSASALGFPVGGRVVSTGTNAYLSLYGDNYEVGTDAVAAANQRVGQLRLHPRTWFGRAHIDGDGQEGGADCERISAPLRDDSTARDLAPLASDLGLTGPPAISGTAAACIGYEDRVFHELQVKVLLAIPPADRSRLGGASSVQADIDVTNSDVGHAQAISAPGGRGYRPIRDLALTLNDLGVPIPLG